MQRIIATVLLVLATVGVTTAARSQISSSTPSGDCRYAVANWKIGSTSMLPNLRIGEVVWTVCLHDAVGGVASMEKDLRLSGSRRTVQRGDVVMVHVPNNPRSVVPRRVIGLPGDRVAVVRNVINLNGRDVPRERLPDWRDEKAAGEGAFEADRETLPGGKTYEVVRDGKNAFPALEDMAERVVASGHVFVLGDNRMNSQDSRLPKFGDPSFDAVIGVVVQNDDEIKKLFDELTKTMSAPRSQTTL